MARTWTDTSGNTFDGDLVEAKGGLVVIKRAKDQKVFEIPLSRFSDTDQAFVLAAATGISEGNERPMEYLDRGLVAIDQRTKVYLSWRMLGTDAANIGFNLYRNGERINADRITSSTNYMDADGGADDKYAVGTILDDGREELSEEVTVWRRKAASAEGAVNKKKPAVPYLEIPLPDPPSEDHVVGDMSVGDLDGDGRYELVFLWEGTEPFLEAVTLEGECLWRIACGINTRKGQICPLVFDFDGDGRAEVACKTAPGTRDGTGEYLSQGPAATDDDSAVVEHSGSGHLMVDQAYITVFKGLTGEELATIQFRPLIGPKHLMKDDWGDSHGYRAGSVKAAVLHHRELGPLLVFTRGIYSRIAMCAYRFDGNDLHDVWTFDTKGKRFLEGYQGMGNHSVAVGDVDGDGSDELIYGACAIDDNGKGLYTTRRGHGDWHSLSDHIPDRPGLELFQGHENSTYGISMRDAGTGEILWEVRSKADVGRGWAADVSPKYRGSECTSTVTKGLDCMGQEIDINPHPFAQLIFFDGDVQRDLRSGVSIDDGSGPHGRILTGWYYRASTCHSTKEDVGLVADILGDWREEMICRRQDNRALLVFSTWIPTERKNPTLMHDPTYRMNVVVQNIGYNQPAHVGYYFADGPPDTRIKLLRAEPHKSQQSRETNP